MTGRLAEQHYAYALRLYARYVRHLPPHVDRDAVRGAALEGLVKAARSYDPGTNVPFKSWAAKKVLGQMRDEMRVQDHLTRRMREKVDANEASSSSLRANPDVPLSLEQEVMGQAGTEGEAVTYADVVCDRVVGELDLWEESSSLSQSELHRLMAALPERELRVVVMRYYEGMLIADVARAMGLSESRVMQVESSALTMMREALLAEAA